jgi:hypothetical protein
MHHLQALSVPCLAASGLGARLLPPFLVRGGVVADDWSGLWVGRDLMLDQVCLASV